MVERVQDLNLPTAVVARLIRDALPDGINISKEARSAISRAASVFVIYLSSSATILTKKNKYKTMMPQNVLDALEEIEFESFIEPLKQSLEIYRKTVKDKKESKEAKKNATAEAEVEAEIEVEAEDDDAE